MEDRRELEMGRLMTEADLTIRDYRPGDEIAINRGFNQAFRCQRPIAEWAWKFPPDPDGRLIVVAEREGELVAHYAALPTRFQIDGVVWGGGQIVDVFATPSARSGIARRGAMVATAEEFFNRIGRSGRHPFLYGFPGPRHRRQGSVQLGYGEMGFEPVTYLCRRVAGTAAHRRLSYRAEPARDWEPRLDELWSRASTDYPVAVVRDAAWALRRLAGHPSIRYHRFLVFPRLSNRPVAFVAFRTDQLRCRWVDLVWDHDHPGAMDLLLHLSARLAVQVGAELEEMWLNGDAEGRARLEASGFEYAPDPADLAFGGRSFHPDLDLGTVAARAYLTMADADLV
jgi:hypothetical protein